MTDISRADGPRRPNWTKPFVGSQSQDTVGSAERGYGTDSIAVAGPGAPYGPAAHVREASDRETAGVVASLEELTNTGAAGDALRLAVADKSSSGIEAALKLKGASGTSAWEAMDPHLRRLVTSTNPKIQEGLWSMVTSPSFTGMITKMKADPKLATHVGDRLAKVDNHQTAEILRGLDGLRDSENPIHDGAKFGDQLCQMAMSGGSTQTWTM